MERETIEAVRNATSIESLISEYTQLSGGGVQLKGVCPVHEDTDPSLFVHSERGIWYCHGCHKGGDAIQFVVEVRRLGFIEAVEFLAERAGLAVGQDEERRDAMHAAGTRHKGYLSNLWDDTPDLQEKRQKALDYLKLRRVENPLSQLFELGMTSSGDITFPFKNDAGKITGHAFRPATDTIDGGPKYYNDHNSPAFNKSRSLFGLPFHKDEVMTSTPLWIVEGYFDAIAVRNTRTPCVAIGGTALTEEQAKRIARSWSRVMLFLDGDSAGHKATLRAIPILYKAGVHAVNVMRPPEDSDPWGVLNGAGFVDTNEAIEGYDYLISHLPDDPALCIREIRPLLEHLRYEDRFAIYQRVGARLGMPQSLFTYKKTAPTELFAPPPLDPNIESVLALLVHKPGELEPLIHLEPGHVDDPTNGGRGAIRDVIHRLLEEEEILSIMDDIDAEDLKKNLARIVSNAETNSIELAARQASSNLAVKWLTKEIWRVAKTDPMAAIELQKRRLLLMEENR